jgi:pyruvate-formate lyase
MATVIKLEAQQAQGDDSVTAKLTEETKKLDNNIATDKKNAGQASTAVPFDAAIAA